MKFKKNWKNCCTSNIFSNRSTSSLPWYNCHGWLGVKKQQVPSLPWYNCHGWLGVKKQTSSFLSQVFLVKFTSLCPCYVSTDAQESWKNISEWCTASDYWFKNLNSCMAEKTSLSVLCYNICDVVFCWVWNLRTYGSFEKNHWLTGRKTPSYLFIWEKSLVDWA